MPPKAKFTREEMIDAALVIVRNEGFAALTARALGAKLGSSARPIFTVFQSMEEVQQAVVDRAKALYRQYIQRGLSDTPAFKGVGTQYILFAVNEPKLFQLLFMKEHDDVPELSAVLPIIDENYEAILSSVKGGYGLPRETAEKLYRHLWIYTHGIAALCATKMCRFTGEEISAMMTEVFIGLLKTLQAK
ncbi:MAG: TetR/AcrR family transcriptional regulator [bacterium]|nr:TetR/AcrR family transcriptional regulator [bacterium]MCM1376629.1 TetR/AcrR family transcriptional regulator [Muribaculum sp.]